MNKITKHILKKFIETFNPIFFSLFFMVSIIYFIRIAKITSIIKVTFIELGKLYIYMLPRLLLYTLPVVFFISIAISLSKMSKDNEISIIFSFGYSPKKLTKIFSILSLGITTFLLIDAIFLIPISKELYNNFVDIKKAQAKLNISSMKFGQKFENWFVFINKSDKKNSFENVIMYQKKKKQENFILADKANILNNKGTLELSLKDGKIFTINKKNIEQTQYKNLDIFNTQNTKVLGSKGVISYWKKALVDKKRAKNFVILILISIFPILTFLLSISIGIFNPRYESNKAYPYIFTTILLYYILIYSFTSSSPILSLIVIPIFFFTASFVFFKNKILKRY